MTSHQASVLAFVRDHIAEHGFSPTFGEIGRGVGIPSTSTIHRVVHELIALGKLSIQPARSRSIEVVDDAEAKVEAIARAFLDRLPIGAGLTETMAVLRAAAREVLR